MRSSLLAAVALWSAVGAGCTPSSFLPSLEAGACRVAWTDTKGESVYAVGDATASRGDDLAVGCSDLSSELRDVSFSLGWGEPSTESPSEIDAVWLAAAVGGRLERASAAAESSVGVHFEATGRSRWSAWWDGEAYGVFPDGSEMTLTSFVLKDAHVGEMIIGR